MAKEELVEITDELPEEIEVPEGELDDALVEELEEVELVPEFEEEFEVEEDVEDFDREEEEEAGHDEETTEALEELESEELQLMDEEVGETLLVDEVEELRAIRREELTMNVDAQLQRSDEFVCQSCFMVKRTSQLANRKKMLCTDCAY
jgi:hypothetical protein